MKTQKNTVILLIALILGLLIIFPDLSRKLDSTPLSPPSFQNKTNQFDNKELNENENLWKLNDSGPKSGFENYSRIVNDFLFFFSLILTLIYFNTKVSSLGISWLKNRNKTILASSIIISLFISILSAFLYTKLAPHLFVHARPQDGFADTMTLFKCLFAGIIAILFGHVMRLTAKQQAISLENEHLKTENIQNRFNALSSQMHPHFFFNSLNSLASLVREEAYDKSLKYINELSVIFRYILKSNWQELVPLAKEIKFLEAYKYMLETRFENKLFFKIDINETALNQFLIPSITLQPLIENVIKHNTVSKEFPMTISIYLTENNELIISNPLKPKIQKEYSDGIGLSNLQHRYQLLMKKSVVIEQSNAIFKVHLPLKQ